MVAVMRGIALLGIAFAIGLVLSACGSSGGATSVVPGDALPSSVPPGTVVVRVGDMSITREQYDHWMRIGDATVETLLPVGPLPKSVAYEPPDFTACIKHLRTSPATSGGTTSQLKIQCRQMYKSIEARILRFLINGYWLRGEAAAEGISISATEAKKEFENIKRKTYPTEVAFQRLLKASHQTVTDLMFAVETQVISTRLLQKFRESRGEGKSKVASTAALNKIINAKWIPQTDCRVGYVVRDCKQYR